MFPSKLSKQKITILYLNFYRCHTVVYDIVLNYGGWKS